MLPSTKNLPADSRFDWTGAFLIAPALTALIAVLNEGYAWGASSPMFIGCALLAVILLTLFVRCEQRAPAPLIDLTLFRQGAFATGNIAGLLAYAALFGLFFLLPFVFVRAYQDSAFAAGLRLTIVPVLLGVVTGAGGERRRLGRSRQRMPVIADAASRQRERIDGVGRLGERDTRLRFTASSVQP